MRVTQIRTAFIMQSSSEEDKNFFLIMTALIFQILVLEFLIVKVTAAKVKVWFKMRMISIVLRINSSAYI